jgi:hypothetical protein
MANRWLIASSVARHTESNPVLGPSWCNLAVITSTFSFKNRSYIVLASMLRFCDWWLSLQILQLIFCVHFSSFRVTCPTYNIYFIFGTLITSSYPVYTQTSEILIHSADVLNIAVLCIKLSETNMRGPHVHPPRDSSPSRHWQRYPLSPVMQ